MAATDLISRNNHEARIAQKALYLAIFPRKVQVASSTLWEHIWGTKGESHFQVCVRSTDYNKLSGKEKAKVYEIIDSPCNLLFALAFNVKP